MRLSDYEKIASSVLSQGDIFILDTASGTKTILAKDLAKALSGLLTAEEFMSNVDILGLEKAADLKKENALLVGTEGGNKKINITDAIYEIMDPIATVGLRRSIWRGKNLGLVVTQDQWNEIKAGTFKGMFLGDYWEIGGRIWRIVDFDYWFETGDKPCRTHHLVIASDTSLDFGPMNDTNTTEGGYIGSKMYREGLAEAKSIIHGAFGADHILSHREYLSNSVADGHVNGSVWANSTIDLPNEIMIYGCYIFTPAGNGQVIMVDRYSLSNLQLAAFAIKPDFLRQNRQNIWLRNVVSSTRFAFYDGYYMADSNSASANCNLWIPFGIVSA